MGPPLHVPTSLDTDTSTKIRSENVLLIRRPKSGKRKPKEKLNFQLSLSSFPSHHSFSLRNAAIFLYLCLYVSPTVRVEKKGLFHISAGKNCLLLLFFFLLHTVRLPFSLFRWNYSRHPSGNIQYYVHIWMSTFRIIIAFPFAPLLFFRLRFTRFIDWLHTCFPPYHLSLTHAHSISFTLFSSSPPSPKNVCWRAQRKGKFFPRQTLFLFLLFREIQKPLNSVPVCTRESYIIDFARAHTYNYIVLCRLAMPFSRCFQFYKTPNQKSLTTPNVEERERL